MDKTFSRESLPLTDDSSPSTCDPMKSYTVTWRWWFVTDFSHSLALLLALTPIAAAVAPPVVAAASSAGAAASTGTPAAATEYSLVEPALELDPVMLRWQWHFPATMGLLAATEREASRSSTWAADFRS